MIRCFQTLLLTTLLLIHTAPVHAQDARDAELSLLTARADVLRVELQKTRELRAKRGLAGPITLLSVGGLALAGGVGGALFAAAEGDRHDPTGFLLAVGTATVGLGALHGGAVWLILSKGARRRAERKALMLEGELTQLNRRLDELTPKPHAQLRLAPLLSRQIAGATLSVTF